MIFSNRLRNGSIRGSDGWHLVPFEKWVIFLFLEEHGGECLLDLGNAVAAQHSQDHVSRGLSQGQ